MVAKLSGTVAGLLLLCVVLPTIADAVQAAVPALLSLLILLAIVRLALPPSRRRW